MRQWYRRLSAESQHPSSLVKYLPNQLFDGKYTPLPWNGKKPLIVVEAPTAPRAAQFSHVNYSPQNNPFLQQPCGAFFDAQVAKYGSMPVFSSLHQNDSYTWSSLSLAVDSFALGLINLGVKKGDRVGVWLPNCSEWLISTCLQLQRWAPFL